MKIPIKPVLLLCIFIFLFGSEVHSKIIRVPLDVPTIQEAIDIASGDEGDMVLVAPGTYFENIDFKGREIVVKSEEGPETTIIDGGQLDHRQVRRASEHAAGEPDHRIRDRRSSDFASVG